MAQWCQKKNLLGLILHNGAFQLYRASFKANKIRELTTPADHEAIFTCFTFSPESDIFAVSNSKGELLIDYTFI